MVRFLCISILVILLPAIPAFGGDVEWQDVSLDIPQPERGKPFPDFELPATDGVLTAVSSYGGKPLLVVFCACYADTACAAVRAIEDIRNEYSVKVNIVVVCSEIAPSWKAQGYAGLLNRTRGLVDSLLIDDAGRLRVPYLVGSFPTAYLIDKDFILRYRGSSIADLNGSLFRDELRRLAGVGTGTP